MPSSSPVRVRRWQATAILTLFFFAVAGAAAIGWWYAREAPPHQGPIVVITVDGLSPAALPPAEMPTAAATEAPPVAPSETTPALAALARNAVVFERAYTHSPQLLPAHASLLSGQLPFEHGVRDDGGFTLPGGIRTLPELLRNRGFATGGVVSSFLLRRHTGIAQGFSFFEGEGEDTAVARSGSDAIEAAAQWARGQRDRRFFLLTQVDAADAELAVARLVDVLEEQEWYDTSTIVLVGDRGRADVGAVLEESALRVPLLIKQPDFEGAGRRVTAPVQHIDVLPTILDLVRAPVPRNLRGRSLRAVLTDEDERLAPQPIYSEWLAAHVRFDGHPVFALTVNDSRYVRAADEQIVQIPDTFPKPAVEQAGLAAPVDDGAAETSGPTPDDLAPLRATLDRLIAGSAIGLPVAPPPAEFDRLAQSGFLPGLRPQPAAPGDTARLDVEAMLDVAAAHQEAARLAGERRYDAAIRRLQGIVRTHPNLASVHYQIGLLSVESGRLTDAVAAFRAAALLRPDAPEIPRAMALALAQLGEEAPASEQAAVAVELAAGAGPAELSLAHMTAARVALAFRDRDAALTAADAAQAANPDLPARAFVEGSWLADEGAHEQALPLLQNAALLLEQHESAADGLYEALGATLAALGRTADAEAAFRNEMRAFPRNIGAYTRLAALYGAAERHDDVADVLEALLVAVPTPAGYSAAARTWGELGQRARAEAIRSAGRARFRGDPSLVLLARERSR